MPFISSPVAYPPTSSPKQPSPRKKRRLSDDRDALQSLPVNRVPRVRGGFLVDDESDDDTSFAHSRKETCKLNEDQSTFSIRTPPLSRTDSNLSQNEGIYSANESVARGGDQHFEEPNMSTFLLGQNSLKRPTLSAQTCSGLTLEIPRKSRRHKISYERQVAERSTVSLGRAQKAYYGVEIHSLLENATRILAEAPSPTDQDKENLDPQIVDQQPASSTQTPKTLLWTEKYRARKFTDLVGDERTHRSVLRWLKSWDPVVFPGAAKPKSRIRRETDEVEGERVHRKLLLLAGPPGLGKTTLAHVCAKQAGYEVQEINASDERSRDVVKGRIRDMVGTQNVRPVGLVGPGKVRKASRPVCVVVDEVDGVVSGSGGSGEGGFIKALIELIALDQRNSATMNARVANPDFKRKRKGDRFRMLRPLILICNDVYHPSLRLLRQGTTAEIVHVRKPALNMVIPRLQNIFENEGVPCDSDGVRQLCEAAWGVSNRKEDRSANGTGDGDIRGILVVGEWAATKLKACKDATPRLTRRWLEQNVLSDLAYGGGAARGIGRGGSREVVEKVFMYNAGFPVSATFTNKKQEETSTTQISPPTLESSRTQSMERLRQLIHSSGEVDRIMTDCFAAYPTYPYQDDTFLTKPTAAYDWLYFHDALSSAVREDQEWELSGYLSHPILAFHHLFASTSRNTYSTSNNPSGAKTDESADAEPLPFSGPRASYAAHEAEKANRASLQALQTQLSIPLRQTFRSTEATATELAPYALRMLNPDVKPVLVGGSGSERSIASVRRAGERVLVSRGVECMIACGVRFERSRVDVQDGDRATAGPGAGWVYRMEPPLDTLGYFETAGSKGEGARVRFAIRQVLEQEWEKEVKLRETKARLRRGRGGNEELDGEEHNSVLTKVQMEKAEQGIAASNAARAGLKRDFFGRPISAATPANDLEDPAASNKKLCSGATNGTSSADKNRIWVTYHEGYSNAVRKGITLKELMDGL